MEIDEFIQQMENNYECSEEFRNRIRNTLQKIKDLDVSYSTKISLMQKAEETYLRHSRNFSNLNNILISINENNEFLARNLEKGTKNSFDIDLD